MNGIRFGKYHSWDDFRLILQPDWELDSPEAKITQIDVPGADGVLDFTEAFGEIRYKNRKLKFNFKTIVPRHEFWHLFSQIQNAIGGQKMKIIIDNDRDWYYVGRISLDRWKANDNIGSITVECDCQPYKYRTYPTVITSNDSIIVCKNSRMPVIPTITSSGGCFVDYNGITFAVSSGTHKFSDMVFHEGNNILTVTGNSTLTIEYQEGSL